MTKALSQSSSLQAWLYVFIGIHLLLWTAVPAYVRDNLPLDAIEGTIWGHQLQLGYDKNPFLNGWLTALAGHFSQPSGWMIYFFSQLSVVACLWAVWKIGKQMMPATYAFASVLLLEGLQYFNLHAIDFNDNTLELGLWGLTAYSYYQALRHPKLRYWVFTAIFAALGIMAKYYTLALLAGMGLFLICNKHNRRQLSTREPYLALLILIALILPHTIWLFFHDFITVKYVFLRTHSVPKLRNHYYFPYKFAWEQLQVFLPAFVMGLLLTLLNKKKATTPAFILPKFDKQFLFYVGFAPFILTLLLSIVFGIRLRAGWGMPLLSLWSLALIAWLKPQLSIKKLTYFAGGVVALMGLLLSAYVASLIDSSDTSSANFPGQEIANKLTEQWHARFHTPLQYVAGSRWVGGNVEFYSQDHPAVFVEWDKKRAPWISLSDMTQKGGIFVWSISDNETLPESIMKVFPQLEPVQIMEFDWHRNTKHLAPIKIGIAFLPPRTIPV